MGTVEPSSVTNIQVSYITPTAGVFPGDSVQLSATPLDVTGAIVLTALTYSSSNPAVATITTMGLIHAVSAGTTSISVAAAGQSVHLPLTVDGNVTGNVLMLPAQATVTPGQFVQLTATVTTTLGNPARNKTVTWSTADLTKVSVDQTGKATGVAASPGVSVCATATDAPAVKGCATVIVQ
jgi:uncharacterized protein YjdB